MEPSDSSGWELFSKNEPPFPDQSEGKWPGPLGMALWLIALFAAFFVWLALR